MGSLEPAMEAAELSTEPVHGSVLLEGGKACGGFPLPPEVQHQFPSLKISVETILLAKRLHTEMQQHGTADLDTAAEKDEILGSREGDETHDVIQSTMK